MARKPQGVTLAQLILDRKGDRSFARLADDCGGIPAGRRLQQMATRPIKNFPDPETITHMAKGLNVPPGDVVAASARSLGVPVGENPDDLVVPGAGRLPGMARDALLYMGRALVAMESSSSGKVVPVPTLQPQGSDMTPEHYALAAFIPEPDEDDDEQ